MQAEVVVVGAGIMGSATAYALARHGRDVLLVERFHVGHQHGSSHGRSRIVRLAYPEVEFVELAKEAFAGWRELEEESGQELLELNGLLELVESSAQSSADALAAAGAEYELLDGDVAASRWPVGVPHGWTVLFQPEAGIVRAAPAPRPGLVGAGRVGPPPPTLLFGGGRCGLARDSWRKRGSRLSRSSTQRRSW